ncbi:MAG: aldo/keto reductase [Anaerolineae bacterium]
MRQRRLGRAGIRVSELGLGTMTFGYQCDEPTSFAILDRAAERGVTFLDTADVYPVPMTLATAGGTEEILGRWLKGKRHRFVVGTKCFFPMGKGQNDRGLSRRHVLDAVDESLRRLQTDYIDLYQIHGYDAITPLEETLGALDDLVRQGKVRYIGCSNLKAWHLAKYLRLSEQSHWARFISLQPIYSALNRGIENEVLPLCAEEGLGVMVYNPLAGGVLTGKYKIGEEPSKGTRLGDMTGYQARYATSQAFDIVAHFVGTARSMGLSPAQLALAWVLAEPRVTCPIVGARTVEQLDDTLGGLDVSLTPKERDAIPAVLPGRWVGVDPVYDRQA